MGYSANASKAHPLLDPTRVTVCRLLNQHITETIDLQLKARTAAAAIKDRPCVLDLKPLFEGIARDLIESADVVAGHIHALEGRDCATIRRIVQQSPEDFERSADDRKSLQAMLSSYAKYDSATRNIIKTVEEMGDSETEALLKRICFSTERNLWLLETYLEASAVGLHGRKLPQWTPAFENDFRNLERNQRICSHGI